MSDGPFAKVLAEMDEIHMRKGADYASQKDPFRNIRRALKFGQRPWVGAVQKADEKMARIENFIENGTLQNEGVRDSLIDCANYFAIAVALYDEEHGAVKYGGATGGLSCVERLPGDMD